MTKPSCKCWEMEWREDACNYVPISKITWERWGQDHDNHTFNPYTGNLINDDDWTHCPHCGQEAVNE
jgi:hypothetical protein